MQLRSAKERNEGALSAGARERNEGALSAGAKERDEGVLSAGAKERNERSDQPRSAMQERSAMQRPLKECTAGALNEGALNAGALSEAAPSEGVLREAASSEGALSEASFSEGALSEGAFGEELWVAKKVCSSSRAAEDGATTKVEWRSKV